MLPKDQTWPIISQDEIDKVSEVLASGKINYWTGQEGRLFEEEWSKEINSKYSIAVANGTVALELALIAAGIGKGDEVIVSARTFIASASCCVARDAVPVCCDVDMDSQNCTAETIAPHITSKTKAIICVHLAGWPCDMDPIMEIAARHDLKVIEDVSHAQGALYKGRLVGTIGHVGAFSIMSGKSLACGEGGVLITANAELYERAVAFGHYERTRELEHPELSPFAGMPLGGYKYRMHQLSSAVGRVQLAHYRERVEEIQQAMNYFWDLLEGVPGIRAHRPARDSGSTMGGWYSAHGLYVPEELNGLPVARFCAALQAEGVSASPGASILMHTHPVLNDADVYGHGKPTRIAHSDRDLRQPLGSLPVTESLPERCYGIPWFKHDRSEIIEEYAGAFRKVAENANELA